MYMLSNEQEELHGVMKTYLEKSNKQESGFDKVAKVLKLVTGVATIGILASEIISLVSADDSKPTV